MIVLKSNLWNWRLNICSDSGAFKTLDKDNSGTIKVNVKEVNSYQCIFTGTHFLNRLNLLIGTVHCFHELIFSAFVFSVASVDHVLLSPDDASHTCYAEPLCLPTQYKIFSQPSLQLPMSFSKSLVCAGLFWMLMQCLVFLLHITCKTELILYFNWEKAQTCTHNWG